MAITGISPPSGVGAIITCIIIPNTTPAITPARTDEPSFEDITHTSLYAEIMRIAGRNEHEDCDLVNSYPPSRCLCRYFDASKLPSASLRRSPKPAVSDHGLG